MLKGPILWNYASKIMFAKNLKHCKLLIILKYDYHQFLANKMTVVFSIVRVLSLIMTT